MTDTIDILLEQRIVSSLQPALRCHLPQELLGMGRLQPQGGDHVRHGQGGAGAGELDDRDLELLEGRWLCRGRAARRDRRSRAGYRGSCRGGLFGRGEGIRDGDRGPSGCVRRCGWERRR